MVAIAPLPVSVLVLIVFPYSPPEYWALGAHISFLGWVFLDNDSKRLREAQATTVGDHISLFVRYYCAFYIGIALFFGSAAAFYLIAPSNATLSGVGKWVVCVAGLLLFAALFSSKKTVALMQPSTKPIRGTEVKGGDDLPNYLPPPPGGLSG